jgi:hypothetical protein
MRGDSRIKFMERHSPKLNGSHEHTDRSYIILQVVSRDLSHLKGDQEFTIEFSAIANAVHHGIKEAIAEEERLLDYPELARRLRLGIRAAKDLVNCGRITPALRYANVARFHWPSVLQELKRHPLR